MDTGQILSQEIEPSNLKERISRFVSKISFWKKLNRNQQFSLIAVLAFVLILPIATFVALQPTRPFSRAQFPATSPVPPLPDVQKPLTVLESRDDDGHIGAKKCGGSPCENSLVIYSVGEGQFRQVESVRIQMHDHHRSLKYSFYVRERSGNWTRLVDKADVKTGANRKVCRDNKIGDRRHPPGTEDPVNCFKDYSVSIGREIDAARIELSGSNHHLHIKYISWFFPKKIVEKPVCIGQCKIFGKTDPYGTKYPSGRICTGVDNLCYRCEDTGNFSVIDNDFCREVVVNCQTNSDCQKYEYCYQPPMPPCPPGAACVQVLPPKYCRVRPTPTATPTPTRSPTPTNTPTPTPRS